MYCLACGQGLHGVASGRCPECGRMFDVDNRASFAVRPIETRKGDLRFALIVGLIGAGIMVLAGIAGMLMSMLG